jgi:hypothetical protein
MNQVYVLGGHTDNHGSTDKIEVYQPEGNRWRVIGATLPYKMDSFRVLPSAVNNKCLIVGGRIDREISDRVFLFDLTSGAYRIHSRLRSARQNFKVMRFNNEYVLVGGGLDKVFGGRF